MSYSVHQIVQVKAHKHAKKLIRDNNYSFYLCLKLDQWITKFKIFIQLAITEYETSYHALQIWCGGTVASWLVCFSPDQAVRVRALAEDIAFCSWARHFHFHSASFSLSTQVYKWVPVNLMLGVTLRLTSIPSRKGGGGNRNTRSCFMLQKPG